jgi:hypothetical protein
MNDFFRLIQNKAINFDKSGITSLAPKVNKGVSAKTLANKLNPDYSSHKLNIEEFLGILDVLGEEDKMDLLSALACRYDYSLAPMKHYKKLAHESIDIENINPNGTLNHLNKFYGKWSREHSESDIGIVDALEKGVISAKQYDEIKTEIEQDFIMAHALLDQLKNIKTDRFIPEDK